MSSIWANFNHVFEMFQVLFFTFLLQQKYVLGTRLEEVVLKSLLLNLLNPKKNLQYLLNCHARLSNTIFQHVGSLLCKSIGRNILLTL